jgi:threonyl-tRNA synthetase
LGTHERFISFLIERWGGAFPTWMAPVQVKIVPVAEDFMAYAEKIAQDLREKMVRVEIDTSNDSFSKKVRNSITKKIPNTWIVGANEVKDNTVTWRRHAVEKQSVLSLPSALDAVGVLVRDRVMDNFPDVELPA